MSSSQASPSSSFAFSDLDDGIGLSSPATAQHRRALLDLINCLRNTGIQKDIDLPMIAVIGSQSAGKSSLIESISGITLPRSSGTCTRLTHADAPWTCAVNLHFISDDGGKPRIVPFGDIITAKPDVEERIRRAQRAILNPSKDTKRFLEGADPAHNEISFSKSYISLEISGPDVADLSFVDLPGLIASVGQGGNVEDIILVRDLVMSYIEKPSCLILLTVACETDFENQGAHHLAKRFDPEGKRTVGVLTKPDRIPWGEEASWVRLIRNEREPLVNNWFCVKQPSSHTLSLGIKWGEARHQEEEFFNRTQPWRSLDPLHKAFLGTGNLTERLSLILAELIAKRLPEIQAELYNTIQQTERELSQLPQGPSDNPVGEMLRALDDFKKEFLERVEGTPEEDGILQCVRPHAATFRRQIRATAPNFVPWEFGVANRYTLPAFTFLSNEEECDIEDGDGPISDHFGVQQSSPKRTGTSCSTDEASPEGFPEIFSAVKTSVSQANSRDRTDCEVAPVAPSGMASIWATVSAGTLGPLPLDSAPSTRVGTSPSRPRDIIHVDEVMRRAEISRTRELPGHYPFVVQKAYITEFVKKWREPAITLFDAVNEITRKDVEKLVHKHFGRMGRGSAKQSILMIMFDHLDAAAVRSKDKIEWLLQLESSPATVNTHYYLNYKSKFLIFYKGFRHKDGSTPKVWSRSQKGVKEAIMALSQLDIHIKPEDFSKLLPSDPMEPALNIMASVRAYFQIAYKRFVDEIPNAIDYEAVRGLGRGLDQALRDGLQLMDADAYERCASMLQEPPLIARRRQELNRRLERLKGARVDLMCVSV
ncbi:hypothetical protein ID866_9634 [Astraeus odoratus]|nr:hypothetical protein ID866_9634 [Astraeus odoratus]